MTSKDQERKALEQIRQIVAGLGEGSYIGMALEGCFEDAEENIENDFGVSWKQRYELVNVEVERIQVDAQNFKAAAECYARERDSAREHAAQVEDRLREAEEDAQEWQRRFRTEQSDHEHTKNELARVSDKMAAQGRMIITLKARLYDLLCTD